MQELDAQQIAIDAKPTKANRQAILFEFASGHYGFWTGAGDVDWNGYTFKSGGQLFEIELPEMRATSESLGATVKLYASPELPSSVLHTIFDEEYMFKDVHIYEVMIDPDTREKSFLPSYSGEIHGIDYNIDEAYLVARLESKSIDYSGRCGAMANDAHHRQISPDDLFYVNLTAAFVAPRYFGRPAPAGSINSNSGQAL